METNKGLKNTYKGYRISLGLSKEMVIEIQQIAAAEERSLSATLRILIAESIRGRRTQNNTTTS